ncbi:hypothetical protein EYC80_008839 [Monilinia laxa]|uniref:Uncharacterized protein n=1 Tax=Monilinia laxa TaxID=61186 RepID=A0A5N6K204_MONLA|nr:hypothetical protein EYC80_008839 [Monilinia laxa]
MSNIEEGSTHTLLDDRNVLLSGNHLWKHQYDEHLSYLHLSRRYGNINTHLVVGFVECCRWLIRFPAKSFLVVLDYWEFITMFSETNPGTPYLPWISFSHGSIAVPLPLYVPSDPSPEYVTH